MASEKQILANQLNAQKSTGPVTIEGKEIVSKNAIKHGLLSSVVVLEDEDQDKFNQLSERIYTHFKPENDLQELLVDKLVATAWRLRRVLVIEKGILSEDVFDLNFSLNDSSSLAQAFTKSLPSMAVLNRYEITLQKEFYSLIRQYQLGIL
ncbi:MAG: hypothetical protein IPM57_03905 [Oligoflexia bacterium]|nr:hypothetical protein [Oligoflexia bacterium]